MDSSEATERQGGADTTLSFGYLLRRLRKARDLTQEAAALRAGCTADMIHKIETDARRPSLSLAHRLANILALAGDDRAAFIAAARARRSPGTIPLPTLPALSALPARPARNNLPPQTTPFIGRERELAALADLLASPGTRLITICGLGGVGKTRLALAAAERQAALAAAGEGRFVDGVSLAPLAGISSAAQLTSALAAAAGLSLEVGPRSPRRQLLDYLRSRRLLLILDNYDQLVGEVGLLVEIVESAPAVAIVVTCRERLQLHFEQILALDGLATPPRDDAPDATSYSAVQLFLRAAQRARPGFAPANGELLSVAAICRLVEGLPLAIELAAAWVGLLSPAAILAELRQGFALLTTELRDIPERQRSVRAICAAVWQRLGPEERAVFGRLGCFRGGFTLEAAREVCDASLPVLARLVNHALLRQGPDQRRYSVHELLRQYAVEQHGRLQPQEDLYARHAAYYCGLLAREAAGLGGARQQAAVAAIGAEDENLHAAWHHAVAAGLAPLLELAADSLGRYYEWQGYLHEGEGAFRAAAAWATLERGGRHLGLRARLMAWHGAFCTFAAGPGEALQPLQRSLDLLEAAAALGEDVRAERAFALWRLGRLRALQGQGEAAALFEQSLALYRAIGRGWETGAALGDLGALLFDQGQLAAANRALGESQAICERAGDSRGLVQALQLRSRVCFESDQLGEAEQLARRSSELALALGSRSGVATALGRLGIVLMHTDRYEGSRACLEQSLAVYERLGDRPMTAMAHNRLALVLLHLGEFEAAYGHAQLAVMLGREPGGLILAQSLQVLAFAEGATGDPAAADAVLEEGIRLCEADGLVARIGALLADQSTVAWVLGDEARARALAVAALRRAVEQHNLVTLGLALLACIAPLAGKGMAERAAELYGMNGETPLWRRSRLVGPYREALLAAISAALPPERLAAALERGRGLERWATARALLAELEALGWERAAELGAKRRHGAG